MSAVPAPKAEGEEILGIGAASAPAAAKRESEHHPIVSECRDQRAAAAVQYTISDAVFQARNLRRSSETLLADWEAKRLIDTLLVALEFSPAYLKALVRGQDVFVLAEQDRAAPYAIRQWAEVAGNHKTSPEKVLSARAKAKRWEENPLISKKWPD